jgi:hypothetical protein
MLDAMRPVEEIAMEIRERVQGMLDGTSNQ